LSIAVGTSII
jgi:hypothetical protein